MSPPEMTFPDGGTRAWMVTLGAGCVLFYYHITHQLSGYSASEIDRIGSVEIFFLFGAGVVGGPLFDRHDAKVIWAPSLMAVFGVIMTAVRVMGFIMLGTLGFAFLGIRARFPPRKREFFKPEASKKKNYIATLVAVFLLNVGSFTSLFHPQLYGKQHIMSTSMSIYVIAIQNGASFFGSLVPGVIVDKIGPMNMLFIASVITSIVTFCWVQMSTNGPIIGFAILYGFFSGGMTSLSPAAFSNYCSNPQVINTYIGMRMAVMSVATLIDPQMTGALLSGFL
ncbi:hypothetical protein P168DRAFT_312786 [Aspergillus campestris IBT 28561]|uniref:MFS general substrate transporter n=1 Tax=Aspergillus campestris (strain IBT 28561) TaxID=1392248 RepID=A0A2I1CVP2_ASPC2|nr:uncharacterized protein P168DRAFT_312786 [Aspergillus campestris IBT 28561]PKY01703.1 hypothetical protein P168DRAFT_312786 [Aspergillus campestris IBT 28561]